MTKLLLGEDLSLYGDSQVAGPEADPVAPAPPSEIPWHDGKLVGRVLEVGADGNLVWNLRPRVPYVEGRLVGSVLTISDIGEIVWAAVRLPEGGGYEEVIATDMVDTAGRGQLYYGPTAPVAQVQGDLWLVTPSLVPVDVVVPPVLAPTLTWPATSAGTTVVASWTAVNGATAYRLKLDGVDVQQVAALTFSFTGLPEGSRTLTVRGTNAGGEGPQSTLKTCVVANQAPPPVTNLIVTTTTPTSISVAWSYSKPVDWSAYVVTSSPAGTPTITAEACTVAGLPGDSPVTVSVSVRDTGGLTSSVVSVSGRTLVPPPVQTPPAPTGLHATRIGYSSADFAWNASAGGADRYEVSGDGTNFGSVGGALSYAWGGLAQSTNYYFYVRGVNAAGAGQAAAVLITTLPQVHHWDNTYADRTIGYGGEAWSVAGISDDGSGILFTQDNWASGANSTLYALDINLNTGPYNTQPDRWIRFVLSMSISFFFNVTVWMGYPGTCRWQGWTNGGGVSQQGAVAANGWPQTITPNEVNNASSTPLNRLQIAFGAGLGSPGVYKLREFQIVVRQITGQTPVYNPA